jgi:hypothetical protein
MGKTSSEVERARALIERGKGVVEDQRRRIERLSAIGASTDRSERVLADFLWTLWRLELHLRAVQRRAGVKPLIVVPSDRLQHLSTSTRIDVTKRRRTARR